MAQIENALLIQDDFKLEVPFWQFSETGISCVWGDSGSGKTTLLGLISGLFESKKFKLIVGGEDLARLPVGQREISYVFQDFGLFPHMTAGENILFPAQARKIKFDQIKEHFNKLCERLKLNEFLDKNAALLSGGEQQRVAIARALLLKPKLILFDEPFSQLDTKNKIQARVLIKELNQEFKIPFILVTHDKEDVMELADQILVLSHGKAVSHGLAGEILQSLGID